MALNDHAGAERVARPDGLNLNTRDVVDAHYPRPAMSPAFSIASMPSVNPEPAYIAASAAVTIVSSELEAELGLPVYDEQGQTIDGAMVSPNSLALVNSFLDRILFNFLSSARSTTLASLRPAIVEVLKPRLAKDAIAGADEELQEYLGGDDDELNAFHGGQDAPRDWDLDLVWRRARLRCMVYTRLGDMEEEDEEMYIQQEHLDEYDDDQRVAREIGMVSPAVAIFLTSILEFVGEHALIIATHAAFKRIETRARAEAQLQGRALQGFPRVSVEEMDVEKIALNANLGRLWRAWRKMIRSPRDSVSARAFRGFGAGNGSRKSSITGASDLQGTVPSVAEVLEPDPTAIPLPMSEHDIAEIEVPGYSAARTLHALQRGRGQLRPASLLVTRDWLRAHREPTVEETVEDEDEDAVDEDSTERATPVEEPLIERMRSQSLPPPPKSLFEQLSDLDSEAYETPEEEPSEGQSEEPQTVPAAPAPVARKPISEPSTPSYGSVLNVLSRQMARELQKSPQGAIDDQTLEREEMDPTDNTLPFTRNDYIINDHERETIESREARPEVAPLNLKKEKPTRISTASSVYPDVPKSGEVSPIQQSHLASGEVSPIEPSDDEGGPVTGERAYEEPVSPLLEQHEVEPAEVTPTMPPAIAAQSRAVPAPVPRPTTPPSRQRRPEEGAARDTNREAFIVAPSPLRSHPSNAGAVPPRDLPIDSKRPRGTPETTGAPNLRPLQEMVDAAPDTSDEASTVSQAEREPTHISKWNSGKPPPPPSQKPKPLPPISVPPGVEKAAVQRVTPGSTRNSASISNRTSEIPASTGRTQSLTEKARSRIASSAGGLRGSITSRTSGEEKMSDERHGRASVEPTEKQRDFEDLIASEETIQYTLTPQNMRNIEERKSFVVTSPSVTPSIRSPVTPTPNVPPLPTVPPAPVPAAVPAVPAVPNAPNVPRGSNVRAGPIPRRPIGANGMPIPPPKSSAARRRIVSGVPREARVPRSNTQDFADFIRSTGPTESETTVVGSLATPSSQFAKSQGRFRTSKGGERLQARDAQVRRSQNSDLIALLNAGPPNDNVVGPARRPVPSRFDQNSVASTQNSYVAASVQSSTNSRTGLIEANHNARVAATGKRAAVDDGKPVVKRTQRRVKDPYAISDDEDEEMNAATPTGNATYGREESLAEFLSNAPPPQNGNAPAALHLSQSTIKAVQRRTSNAGAKAKSAVANPVKIGSKISAAATAAASRARSGSMSQDDNMAAPPPPAKPNRSRPQFQARDERRDNSNTRDLADFFNSGPPPGMGPDQDYGSPPVPRKGDEGFGRMFSRRRGRGTA